MTSSGRSKYLPERETFSDELISLAKDKISAIELNDEHLIKEVNEKIEETIRRYYLGKDMPEVRELVDQLTERCLEVSKEIEEEIKAKNEEIEKIRKEAEIKEEEVKKVEEEVKKTEKEEKEE